MGNMAADNAAGKRINSLLDAGSFVEIGGAVTARTTDFNMQEKETPADGVITGYGVIDGNLVYVYSQDATVLNGAIGEMHAKKISNIYDMAMKMGAPVIGFIDCGGIRLQESVDALDGFGMIYAKEVAASGVIPQICGVFGNCGGGLSVGAGDGHHGHAVCRMAVIVGGHHRQGPAGVLHQDIGHGAVLRRSLTHHRGGSRRHGLSDIGVAVGGKAGHGHEDVPGCRGPGVIADAADLQIRVRGG